MENLTQLQVNKMTKTQRKEKLDKLEDLMCNTDYTTSEGEILYSFYSKNANVLINKQNGEF
jgi:hypothetical protein